MIDTYARLLESIAEIEDKAAADAAVTRLIVHLESTERKNMLPRIMRELRKIAARRLALVPRVEVAHEADAPAALAAAAQEGIKAKKAIVNPTLIRGWRAIGNGKLVDRSAKRALISIYQNVTA